MQASRIIYGAVATIALGIASALPGQNPSSFEPAHCDRCYEGLTGPDPQEYAHAFGSVWWDPGQMMDCHLFNSCHGNSQPGRCTEYHYSCGSLAFHGAVDDALERGDFVQARHALRTSAGAVILRGTRLVFRDCDGRIQGVKLLDEATSRQLS